MERVISSGISKEFDVRCTVCLHTRWVGAWVPGWARGYRGGGSGHHCLSNHTPLLSCVPGWRVVEQGRVGGGGEEALHKRTVTR